MAEVDFVARAPRAHEVEELTQKQIMKCLRNKIPGDQFIEMFNLDVGDAKDKEKRLEPNANKVEKLDRFERAEKADRDKDREEEPVKTEREPRVEKQERREREEPRQEREPRPEPRQERQDRREREPRAEKPERREREEPRQEREPKAEQRQEREPRADRQERPPVEEKELEERKPVSRKQLSGAQEKFKGMINELSSTSKARIIDAMGGIIKEVAVKELVNTLKEEKSPVSAVVFDGIITQRILDLASDLKIGTIVGTKMGNITKQPAGTDVWSKDDLN
ncbi:MAG: hypothetical protein AB9860_05545 [Methanomassiliicoccales archaeon]